LAACGADVMGLNCSTGPREMVDPLRALAEHVPLPLSCQPNAGIPENREGVAVYPLQPGELAEYLARFVRDFRLSVVGGCCGTTPVHLKQVIEAVRGNGAARKPPRHAPMLSSGLKAVALQQEPRPLVIGERVNSQGSKKMKELLLANDLHGILAVAREQVEGGAHALDVCVALTERADEVDTMVRTVRVVSGQIEAPLCIDSTEPDVVASALEWLPGVGIVNPRDILPWNEIPADARELAEDLVLARRDDALARVIAHFEKSGGAAKAVVEEKVYDTPEARLHHLIVDRQQKGLIETIDECLKTRSAVGVINDVLLGAMKEVGDRFGAGELILPFVLQSAEVMKKTVAYHV